MKLDIAFPTSYKSISYETKYSLAYYLQVHQQ